MAAAASLSRALRDQHERIEEMLDHVQKASGEDREAVFLWFRRFLAAHEAAEQVFVHPVAEQLPDGSETGENRVEEETEAADLIAEMERIELGSGEFDRLLEELSHAIRRHARAEELKELPGIVEGCADDDLEAMRRALEHADTLVSLRNGPLGSGPQPFAQLLAAAKAEFLTLRRDQGV
jgi:Hemerythrin HHE cation binding domain